jgi:GH15 family glucan-1,4-alpha-glucosidase
MKKLVKKKKQIPCITKKKKHENVSQKTDLANGQFQKKNTNLLRESKKIFKSTFKHMFSNKNQYWTHWNQRNNHRKPAKEKTQQSTGNDGRTAPRFMVNSEVEIKK